jgi:transcriptional regulator with XRE-family HTH domain
MTTKKLDALSMLPAIMKEIRKATGTTLAEAATSLKVSRQYVAQWENGQSTPSKEQLEQWLALVSQEIRRLRTYDKIRELVEGAEEQ